MAAIIILCREILVSGLREYLAELKVSVPVSRLAKWKTFVQMIAIVFLLAGPAGNKIIPYATEFGIIMLWIAALLTLWKDGIIFVQLKTRYYIKICAL
ncbi:CDP-diacylglycerol--glycerol-3-phosphate 3-phosphatidyltransferase [Bartonella doshiae]|uniref:CDP-diacylglycerol--glycerol-3-phosphate 3-phosphatidyltransferase n=1 Tax=Bartonella doshiae TaxID=33044 RepID=A0A380ZPP4_BARDO|nr:CDP-diacylglycerol--glycerol-3-phosphate 3-phosphatidyltransferase [Bartonella doshiae]